MQIGRLVIFVLAAAFLDGVVVVILKEAGIQLGAIPAMLRVAVCWGLVYFLVYHAFGSAKQGDTAQIKNRNESEV